MAADQSAGTEPKREAWENEVLAGYRWGRHGDRAGEELVRLKKLQEAIPADRAPNAKLLQQIVFLEICNWNLEASILALCDGIGCNGSARIGIGHMVSFTDQRWRDVWSWYLACRAWLPCVVAPVTGQPISGFAALLKVCDPDHSIQTRVAELLGRRSELKELYVERFCLALEYFLGGLPEKDSPQMQAHRAAAAELDHQIKALDPQGEILAGAFREGYGGLYLCHHKLFRRYEIILSSIGDGKWRTAMPQVGTDGFERADLLEKYLAPIDSWMAGDCAAVRGEPARTIRAALGEPDETKRFLASLLVSLLRGEQLSARQRAERRAKG